MKKVKLFGIDDLKEACRCNILSGKKDVYDVTHKDLKDCKRQAYYNCKNLGYLIVFKHEEKNKILMFNNV